MRSGTSSTGSSANSCRSKSEKRLDRDDEAQLTLLAGLGVKEPPSRDDVPTQTVSYERRAKVRDAAVTESGLRFGPEVPVQTIEVTDPTIEAIPQAGGTGCSLRARSVRSASVSSGVCW